MEQQLSPAQKAWQTRRRNTSEARAEAVRHLANAASLLNKYGGLNRGWDTHVSLALVVSAIEQLPEIPDE